VYHQESASGGGKVKIFMGETPIELMTDKKIQRWSIILNLNYQIGKWKNFFPASEFYEWQP